LVHLHARVARRVAGQRGEARLPGRDRRRGLDDVDPDHARPIEDGAQEEAHAEPAEQDRDVVAALARSERQLGERLLGAPPVRGQDRLAVAPDLQRAVAVPELDADAVLDGVLHLLHAPYHTPSGMLGAMFPTLPDVPPEQRATAHGPLRYED